MKECVAVVVVVLDRSNRKEEAFEGCLDDDGIARIAGIKREKNG